MSPALKVMLRLHNRVCMSGCVGDAAVDHARRTQSSAARVIRQSDEPHRLLHDAECVLLLDSSKECVDPAKHAEHWRAPVADLLA